jgi:SAM-dependent methyltransferase
VIVWYNLRNTTKVMTVIDPNKIPQEAKNTELTRRLDILQKFDTIKPTYVPFATLGADMVKHIPISKLDGTILVISDLGLLSAVLKRLKGFYLDWSNITFISHIKEHHEFAQSLKVNSILVEYHNLDAWLSNNGIMMYNLDMKFDVVLGNPPFQPETKIEGDGCGSRCMIWQKFIERAFEVVKNDGHLLFVTPNNWRKGFSARSPHRKAQQLIWSNKIAWVINARSPQDYFPSVGYSVSIDAWHVKIGENNNFPLALQNRCLIPRDTNKISIKILEKFFTICDNSPEIEFCDVVIRTNNINTLHKLKECTETHVYKLMNTSSQVKKGFYDWTNVEPKNYRSKKVMISDSGSLGPIYDDGNCGNGSHYASFIVQNEKEGNTLVEFFNSNLVKFILKQFMVKNGFDIPIELFKHLPKNILFNELCDVFNFTEEELNYMNEYSE